MAAKKPFDNRRSKWPPIFLQQNRTSLFGEKYIFIRLLGDLSFLVHFNYRWDNSTGYSAVFCLQPDHHIFDPHPILPLHTNSSYSFYRSTDLPIYRSTDLPVYRSTDLPVYRSTDLPIYRSTDLPIYRLYFAKVLELRHLRVFSGVISGYRV